MGRYVRRIRLGVLLGLVATCVALATLVHRGIVSEAHASASSTEALGAALYRAGLGPDALAAAGLSSAQVTSVIAEARASYVERSLTLDSADAGHATAKADCIRLERSIQAGDRDSASLVALPTARSLVDTTAQTRDAVLDAICADGCSVLSPAARAIIENLAANRGWDIPIEFKVTTRTEAEWVALRNALAAESTSAKLGLETPPDAAALLSSVRADPTVALAASHLAANLASARSAWETAVAQ